MTEADYITELKRRWPRSVFEDASLETLALADRAVCEFPESARLWVILGDLIQLGPESNPHTLEDALKAYQRATEVDPHFAEAWDEIGHYYDSHLDDEATAQTYFDRAAQLRQSAGA